MKTYTDYPFIELGDIPFVEAPIRECKIVDYDGDKYLIVEVEGQVLEVKKFYVYKNATRLGEGEIGLTEKELEKFNIQTD